MKFTVKKKQKNILQRVLGIPMAAGFLELEVAGVQRMLQLACQGLRALVEARALKDI